MKYEINFLNNRFEIVKKKSARYNEKEKTLSYRDYWLFGKEHILLCDINNSIRDKNKLIFFYDLNNKQLTLNELKSNINFYEYVSNFQKAQLSKELALEKPKGIEDILPLLTFIAMGLLLLFVWFSVKDIVNSLNARFDLLNKTIQNQNLEIEILKNMSIENNKLFNYLMRRI
jgi:hypothetical protein